MLVLVQWYKRINVLLGSLCLLCCQNIMSTSNMLYLEHLEHFDPTVYHYHSKISHLTSFTTWQAVCKMQSIRTHAICLAHLPPAILDSLYGDFLQSPWIDQHYLWKTSGFPTNSAKIVLSCCAQICFFITWLYQDGQC